MLFSGGQYVGEYDPNGITARFIPGPGLGEPVTAYDGSGTSSPYWYAADERGSVMAVMAGSARSPQTKTGPVAGARSYRET